MARGFGGEDEAGRANDPSGPGTGIGRSEDLDAAQADRDKQADRERDRDRDAQEQEVLANVEKAAQAAINAGINPFSDTFKNVLAANMMRGKFGNVSGLFGTKFGDGDADDKRGKTKGGITQTDEVKGFIAKYAPTTGDKIKSALGLTDIKATLTPGQKTPFGALPGILSLYDVPGKVAFGLGNQLLGFLGIGVNPVTQAINEQIAASNKALAAQKGKAPQSIDIQKYTNPTPRPDNPIRATTPAGQFLQDQFMQKQSKPSTGLPSNTVQTAGLFDTLKSTIDGVKSIPGGYQIGDTQYTGTYSKNPSARTFSKTEEEYVAPFSAEMFKQGISTLNPFD